MPCGTIGVDCAYFEPIHGSAPSIAGKKRSIPTGQILAAALMLDHLGESLAAQAIRTSIIEALRSGEIRIYDAGGADGDPEAVAAAVVRGLPDVDARQRPDRR